MIEVLRFLARSWKVLMAFSIAGAVLAAVPAFLMKPTYRAQVVLAPSSTSSGQGLAASLGPLSDVAAMTGLNLAGAMQEKVEALATLQSKRLIIDFIESNNLRPVLFADQWDSNKGEWKSVAPEEVPTKLKAYDEFTGNILGIIESQTTGLVTVTIDWKDPVQAANWANQLVELANSELRKTAITDSDMSLAYLNKQLESVSSVELRSSIYDLIETQLEQRMLATVRMDYAFRVIDPALPSASWEYRSPNRLLIVLSGAVFGFLLGLLFAKELVGIGEQR